MSGHSKWATTKHKKAVIDARRAKSFAKLIKNIEVAAKIGGADLAGNPTLVDAVQKAKKTSVPKDNIDRAIKRGAGIGGVLEPMQAGPTIIEDNCFIGARSEVVEGVIVREGSVLGMGVYLGQSTKIVDRDTGEVSYGRVPPYSVGMGNP